MLSRVILNQDLLGCWTKGSFWLFRRSIRGHGVHSLFHNKRDSKPKGQLLEDHFRGSILLLYSLGLLIYYMVLVMQSVVHPFSIYPSRLGSLECSISQE